jgi:hypothetical protein
MKRAPGAKPRAGASTRSRVAIAGLACGMIGCAALQEIAALRLVDFSLDRVDNVRLAGIRVDDRSSYSDLTAAEAAKLATAVVASDVPLDLVIHVRAENPRDNPVAARLVDLDWTLFLEDHETVSGHLAGTYLLPPGEPVDVPVGAHLDLLQFFRGSGRDLFEMALALSGQGGATKEVRLEAIPTVQTSMGPMSFPGRIVIRRQVGGR